MNDMLSVFKRKPAKLLNEQMRDVQGLLDDHIESRRHQVLKDTSPWNRGTSATYTHTHTMVVGVGMGCLYNTISLKLVECSGFVVYKGLTKMCDNVNSEYVENADVEDGVAARLPDFVVKILPRTNRRAPSG